MPLGGALVGLLGIAIASAASPAFLKRFEREAKALAQLAHPNIVSIHDYGEQDGMPYLVSWSTRLAAHPSRAWESPCLGLCPSQIIGLAEWVSHMRGISVGHSLAH